MIEVQKTNDPDSINITRGGTFIGNVEFCTDSADFFVSGRLERLSLKDMKEIVEVMTKKEGEDASSEQEG